MDGRDGRGDSHDRGAGALGMAGRRLVAVGRVVGMLRAAGRRLACVRSGRRGSGARVAAGIRPGRVAAENRPAGR